MTHPTFSRGPVLTYVLKKNVLNVSDVPMGTKTGSVIIKFITLSSILINKSNTSWGHMTQLRYPTELIFNVYFPVLSCKYVNKLFGLGFILEIVFYTLYEK